MAPSRLKANVIREALVIQAVVKNNWSAVKMNKITKAHLDESAYWRISVTPPPTCHHTEMLLMTAMR